MKKVAILQSNYIPWKGYFDLIASVDEFILFDDMQYTRRDWRNRNYIKTPQGVQWLTVPVKVKGKYSQTIRETEIDGTEWSESHWKSIIANYSRAPHFKTMAPIFEPIYREMTHTYLSSLNKTFIESVCKVLNIHTKITDSSNYELVEGKTSRLVSLSVQAGASEYISGPAAKDYIEESLFQESGVKLTWFSYEGYSEYPQLWGSFTHSVSILDLLFNCGPSASSYMKHAPSAPHSAFQNRTIATIF